MMSKKRGYWLLVISLGAGLLAAGCESGAPAAPGVQGTITIEGSSTVEPISLAAREQFNELNPDVNISVSGNGTGNGFKALARRECDIADASRPIKPQELEACQAAGVEFIEIAVAFDGLTIVVNRENDFIRQLDVAQLQKIFRADLAAKTWQDVNPEWPAEKITIYAPGIASGTHDYFMEVVGADSEAGMRSGDGQTTLSEDDKQLVIGVQGEKYAIGFFGFSWYEANQDELRAVPIVGATGSPVEPTRETIASGEYSPFSRPLFIYVNTKSLERAEVREFVDFYLSNIESVVRQARYVTLPAEVNQRAAELVEHGQAGTHFVGPDGSARSGSISSIYTDANLKTN
jgi:phosphate transport system substrate-binding protein